MVRRPEGPSRTMAVGAVFLATGYQIADSSDRVDCDIRSEILKTFPKPVHVDFDGVRADIVRKPKDLILDDALGNDAAASAHEDLQKR
jgi:hypothetical protein